MTVEKVSQGGWHQPPNKLLLKSKQNELVMNLSEVNNVSDLLAQNEKTVSWTPEEVLEAAYTLEADKALDLCKALVSTLAKWHQDEASNSEDAKRAAAWAVDEGRLHVALLALKEVSF